MAPLLYAQEAPVPASEMLVCHGCIFLRVWGCMYREGKDESCEVRPLVRHPTPLPLETVRDGCVGVQSPGGVGMLGLRGGCDSSNPGFFVLLGFCHPKVEMPTTMSLKSCN